MISPAKPSDERWSRLVEEFRHQQGRDAHRPREPLAWWVVPLVVGVLMLLALRLVVMIYPFGLFWLLTR